MSGELTREDRAMPRSGSGKGIAIAVFDIDGVVRDVSGSYRRAIADTVEHFTAAKYRPTYRPTPGDIDQLKSEGIWNNDWEASQELIYRYFERQGQSRGEINLDFETLVAFFQSRYRGTDPVNMNGYITQEPLLLQPSYLASLTNAGIPWGFFSGAMRAEAAYVLEGALGLENPVVVAMEDAPGKPDPTGLFAVLAGLQQQHPISETTPAIYVGDTVADMWTVQKAKEQQSDSRRDPLARNRVWVGVGVLPPHVTGDRREAYIQNLEKAGAAVVLSNVQELTPELIQKLVIGC